MTQPFSPPFGPTPTGFATTLPGLPGLEAILENATKAQQKIQQQAESLKPIANAFTAAANAIAADPQGLLEHNLRLYQSHLALGASMLEKMLGREPAPVAVPEKDDRRFADTSWDTAGFDLLKQSYLLTSRYFADLVATTDAPNNPQALDSRTHAQAVFYTRLFSEMFSPSNYLPTNPEALSTALASKGESLMQGWQNLVTDLQQGHITMTDTSQFKVGQASEGGNIATTPGQVVFRNHLIELIQYTPTTPNVHATPLLISPPWINRFYILDLKPENSFVNYMLSQGHQVFMISWKNPDASYRNVGFEDYMTDGLLTALDTCLAITNQPHANVIGYCIGGTLLASTLAVLNTKAKGQDKRVNSATFFTTLIDFEKAGELGVFTDEQQIIALEQQMQQDGVLDGKSMAGTFSALRANDLIWSFVVNNYLLGKQSIPFDILFWNGDSTRMPCAMHSWYLRNLYLENNLVKKNQLTLLGTPVDVSKISQPLYMVSAINDHITPWESCYAGFARMQSDDKTFILSKAGHVAGVVNPPTAPGKPVKRSFQTAKASAATGADWLETSTQEPDSWWPNYSAWLTRRAGESVKAPTKCGNAQHKPLCPAPGTYVREQ